MGASKPCPFPSSSSFPAPSFPQTPYLYPSLYKLQASFFCFCDMFPESMGPAGSHFYNLCNFLNKLPYNLKQIKKKVCSVLCWCFLCCFFFTELFIWDAILVLIIVLCSYVVLVCVTTRFSKWRFIVEGNGYFTILKRVGGHSRMWESEGERVSSEFIFSSKMETYLVKFEKGRGQHHRVWTWFGMGCGNQRAVEKAPGSRRWETSLQTPLH